MNGKIMLNGKAYSSSGRPSKEVTIGEWLALPGTKYTDGIVYYIKDVGSSSQYPPLIYSDYEREVGVWRDGKPLYQKTVTFGAVSAGTTLNIHSDVTTVDTLVDVNVMCSISGGFIKIPMALLSVNAEWGIAEQSFTKSTGYLRVDFGSQRSVDGGFATFYYTKTTDLPGSGMWNTDGGKMHHYSTDEKVVGSWIDGKPLYEKTFTGTLANANNTRIALETTWNVRNIYGSIKETNYNQKIGIGCYANASYYCGWVQGMSSYSITLYYSDNFKTNGSYEATIQYTKTTD